MANEDQRLDKETSRRLNSQKLIRGIRITSNPAEVMQEKNEQAYIKRNAKLKRTADVSPSFDLGNNQGVNRTPLLYLDPLFDPILMLMPKDNVRELNRRLRHYYIYHPYIRNIINLHASFPLSDFELHEEDREVEQYYNDYKERKNLLEYAIMLGTDYWLIGEALGYGNWDTYNLEFESFNQYPPEEVEITKTYVIDDPIYYIKASDDVKKMMNSSKPADRAQAEALALQNPQFYEAMKRGKSYRLMNDRLIHLAMRPNKYTLRGISPVLAVVKDLLYEDKLRMLQYTFVDRQTYPIKHWKIGSKEKGWIPPARKFLEFEKLLINASNDPDFHLITHPFIEQAWVSPVTMVKDLLPEFDWVAKRIMVGLFVNDAVLHGDLGPYAAQAISIKVLMNKYMTFRSILEHNLLEKIFRPIAVARKYIKRKSADLDHNIRTEKGNIYRLPKLAWQKLNLLNNTTLQEYVLRLREAGEIPFKVVSELFDWDTESLKGSFKEEESTYLDPAWREARKAKIAEDEKIANLVLEGKKTKEWPMETEETKQDKAEAEEKAKSPKPTTGPSGAPPPTPVSTTTPPGEPVVKPPLGETEVPLA